jgi:hypothetical protein
VGPRLFILNVSDPSVPTFMGQTEMFPGIVEDEKVAGDYTYIACYHGGRLRIVDISNPANPTEAGFYITRDVHRNVRVMENYAYVADGRAGLIILSLTSPLPEISIRPNPDGCWFNNYYEINNSDYTISDMRRMFGDGAVCK